MKYKIRLTLFKDFKTHFHSFFLFSFSISVQHKNIFKYIHIQYLIIIYCIMYVYKFVSKAMYKKKNHHSEQIKNSDIFT